MPSRAYMRKQRQREARDEDRRERGVATKASAYFTNIGPRKAMFVADMIRGMRADNAMRALKFSHRPSAAPLVERLLKAAIDSAKHHGHGDLEKLWVSTIQVGGAGMLKRYHPRAFGRAARIRKRLSHITLELAARD